MTDPIPTLTLLAKLYRDQALAAWTAGDDEGAKFYDGAASGVRVALQILVPMISEDVGGKARGGSNAGRLKQPSAPNPPQDEAIPDRGDTLTNPPSPTRRGGQLICPECGVGYKLAQHIGLHRKRAHGIPSLKDRGLYRDPARPWPKKKKARR